MTGYSFKDLLSPSEAVEQLRRIPFFKSLTNSKLESILKKIKVDKFNDGENIITQGEVGNKLYIIKYGRVDIIKDKIVRKTLEENAYFGERALFFKEPRSATVQAKGFVEVLSLEDEEFKILLETNLKEFIINRLVLQDVQVSLNELEFVREIYTSEKSRILLVKNIKTKYMYILKQIPKDAIYYEQLLSSVKYESEVIKQLDHPFILNFIKLLKDSYNIFYLLEYAKGKSLDDVLSEIGLLNKYQTQFYSACLMMTVDYLHNKNVIHRDIRPANVVVLENVSI